MENASKALIIAASILVTILVIAIGMNVFKSASGTTDHSKAAMEMTAIATFNNQFAGYLNRNLTLSQCNTLIQKIIASNATNSSHQVKFKGVDPTTASPSTGTYTAEYADGYIVNIKQ